MIDTLKAAFVQGRLDKDEFDLRVGQTFASRTYTELAAVTADIPAGLTTAKPLAPARAQGEARISRTGIVLMTATVLYAGMWLLLLPVGDPHAAGALVGIATVFYPIVVIFAGARLIEFLLTRMLTTDLDEHGSGWNHLPAISAASWPD